MYVIADMTENVFILIGEGSFTHVMRKANATTFNTEEEAKAKAEEIGLKNFDIYPA